MNRISRELLSIAREINALDEEGDGSGFQMWHDHENAEQERLDIAQKQGKKYILHHKEQGLWKIQACKSFKNVKKGDLGGFIESEENLSHEGNCWIYGNAMVYDVARVYGNAIVGNKAQVCEAAEIYGNAMIGGTAIISNTAKVYGDAQVRDGARVCDEAEVFGNAIVGGNAKICGDSKFDFFAA